VSLPTPTPATLCVATLLSTPLLQEVIGSAIALLLLSGGAVPLWGGVLLSVAMSFSMLLVERCGVRSLEALFGVLIAIMAGSFAVRAC
jgi:natural resistance-associated macrophage protein